ncbi:hypothetical protein BO224_12530 [Erysipelotrichaceae bacterium NYU-BL-E8]|uniref:Uncharacterized protein n=1 Tax=Ileibacterium valens TaxID=1862668 RepID=A0A1U7ND48_9FIRM|nr:hypothetical protein BO224_12530 [Erysipelotrichaceae bacterium NYU-BL-E8]OLU36809.1 hypothetical protein BO222_11665 [Ileibacterium valens]OLU42589.1 hypothetical protein BM735_01975 [Erysipelotrichaceae bacterium NYU-BL-F16]
MILKAKDEEQCESVKKSEPLRLGKLSRVKQNTQKNTKKQKNSDGLLAPLLNHLRDFCYIFQLRKF